ncbi:MAG: ATP-binding cassette domain-containing protein [Firmicutes bacterium]|nr:ATP-binding cassette domain-containing protein [Bacillota bacterium]
MQTDKLQIELKDVTLGYDGMIVAEHIDLKVFEGEYLAIVGQNGSGKSTLMKTILGLAEPLKGEIIFGENFSRKDIGYLPQVSPIQRDFPASVSEIVYSGFLNKLGRKIFYTKEMKETAMENMELLGLEDLKDACYRDLSGGQQQRVLLARALCATNKMLLVDEPVSGLDPEAQFEMYGILHHLNHNRGVTIIMISHDLEAVDRYASQVLTMGRKNDLKNV